MLKNICNIIFIMMLKIEIMILILILTWKVDLGEEKTELLLSWSLGLRDIGRGSGRSDITLTITMMMIKKMMMMMPKSFLVFLPHVA